MENRKEENVSTFLNPGDLIFKYKKALKHKYSKKVKPAYNVTCSCLCNTYPITRLIRKSTKTQYRIISHKSVLRLLFFQ